jgi:uncharacterized membrane-anchored protein
MFAFGNQPSERTRKLHRVIERVASLTKDFHRAPRVEQLRIAEELLALKAELDAMSASFR